MKKKVIKILVKICAVIFVIISGILLTNCAITVKEEINYKTIDVGLYNEQYCVSIYYDNNGRNSHIEIPLNKIDERIRISFYMNYETNYLKAHIKLIKVNNLFGEKYELKFIANKK